MGDNINFKLDTFEGPLDLLLNLISKNKLNIYDVEISKLLEQYLNYIDNMKNRNLDIAVEFLYMASKLVYIKTSQLLPKNEVEVDLKEELTEILLKYNNCRLLANQLKLLYNDNIFTRKPQKKIIDNNYSKFHAPEILKDSYLLLSDFFNGKNIPKKDSFDGIVNENIISVTSKIVYILKKLYKVGSIEYNEIFADSNLSEKVAIFIALLELIKSKRIILSEDSNFLYFNNIESR